MVKVETGSGETIPITEYVNQSATDAIQSANDYTDQQIQIHFV